MKRLIITKMEEAIISYTMEDNRCIEIHKEIPANSIVGNIYIGRIQKYIKNIDAYFVNISTSQSVYLSSKSCKTPVYLNAQDRTTSKKLVEGDLVLIQVTKDPIKTKEAVGTCILSVPGKHLIVSYGNDTTGFSNKLSKRKKELLKNILQPFLIEPFGVVFRSNALYISNDNSSILIEEYKLLSNELTSILAKADSQKLYSLLYKEIPQYLIKTRDLNDAEFERIVTDEISLYTEIEYFMKTYNKEQLSLLSFYADTSYSLKNLYSLQTHLENALNKRVWLKSGGYLVIEQTEALTVIDVNTGKAILGKDKETTFYKLNLEAAKEIMFQIRLRNLSGIILVDFINMQNINSNEQLVQELANFAKTEPIKTEVIDITKLGLIEMTRKRIYPTLQEQFL